MNLCYLIGHDVEEVEYRDEYWHSPVKHYKYVCTRCKEERNGQGQFSKSIVTRFKNWFVYHSFEVKLISTMLFLIVGMLWLLWYGSYSECQGYTKMGVPAKWVNIWAGCMVEHPKFGWVPAEKYFQILNLYFP